MDSNDLGRSSIETADLQPVMPPVLNTRTMTVHTSTDNERQETAACGSLEHVPEAYIRVVGNGELQSGMVDRCGNCFEDGGGY